MEVCDRYPSKQEQHQRGAHTKLMVGLNFSLRRRREQAQSGAGQGQRTKTPIQTCTIIFLSSFLCKFVVVPQCESINIIDCYKCFSEQVRHYFFSVTFFIFSSMMTHSS